MSADATALFSDLPTRVFASVAEFETFLEREHTTASGLYLKIAKKGTGIASITSSEAIEAALCFGWIDGRANSIDSSWYTVRYTPRRKKSIWSQKNIQTVARLTAEGRMRRAGMEAVEAAKADGRWDRAYAGSATMEVAEDFKAALAMNAAAKRFFESLNRSDRYSVLWRVETASPTSRAGRIQAILEMLAAGSVPGAEPKVAAKSKRRQEKVKISSKVRVEKSKTTETSKERQARREGLRRRS